MDLFPSELVDTAASALPLDKQGSKEESCQKAFPFNKMLPNMLDPEMIEDTTKIVNEVIKGKIQVNLIMNNRAEVPEGAFIGSPRRCGGFFIFVLNQAKTLVEKSKKRQVFPEGENHFTHPFTTKR